MTEPAKTPETPAATDVIEFVRDTNPMLLLVAFIAGALVVTAIVYAIGRKSLTETEGTTDA